MLLGFGPELEKGGDQHPGPLTDEVSRSAGGVEFIAHDGVFERIGFLPGPAVLRGYVPADETRFDPAAAKEGFLLAFGERGLGTGKRPTRQERPDLLPVALVFLGVLEIHRIPYQPARAAQRSRRPSGFPRKARSNIRRLNPI